MNHLTPVLRAMLAAAWVVLAITTASAQQGPEFCWKDTITRGVGELPQSCEAGRDRIGLLCYSKCPANTARFGFDCHSVCPRAWMHRPPQAGWPS